MGTQGSGELLPRAAPEPDDRREAVGLLDLEPGKPGPGRGRGGVDDTRPLAMADQCGLRQTTGSRLGFKAEIWRFTARWIAEMLHRASDPRIRRLPAMLREPDPFE